MNIVNRNVVKKNLAIAALVAICFSGCASLYKLFGRAVGRPAVHFKSADLSDISLAGLTLNTRWNLTNPNAFGLKLASLEYALFIEGHPVVSGRPPLGLTVPVRGSSELHFPAQVQFQSIAPLIETFLNRDRASYRVEGSVGVQTPLGVIVLPMAYSNTFEVPKLPEIRLADPRIAELSLTGATLELPIIVTNKNTFPLPINRIEGALSIAGVAVGSIATPALGQMAARGTRTVPVPVRIDFQNTGLAVARILRGQSAAVQFDARINSGAIQIPVRIDQVVNFLR